MHMPKEMDHNEFQLDDDLVDPFKDFIHKLDDQKSKTRTTEVSMNTRKPKIKGDSKV